MNKHINDSWKEKFKSSDPLFHTGEGFVAMFEKLNEFEWKEFIRVLSLQPELLHTELQIPPEEETLPYITRFLSKLSIKNSKIIEYAIESHITEILGKQNLRDEDSKILFIALSVASQVPIHLHSIRLLKDISIDNHLDINIRYEAAAKLLNQEENLGNEFWKKLVDHTKNSILVPLAISAISKNSPIDAISILKNIKISSSQEQEEFYCSLEDIINKISDQTNIISKHDITITSFPDWSREYIREIIHLEGLDYLEEVLFNSGSKGQKTPSALEELIDYFIINKYELKYRYTGYFEGKFFEEYLPRKICFLHLLTKFQGQIHEITKKKLSNKPITNTDKPRIDIHKPPRLKNLVCDDLSVLVEDSLSGQVFLPEPGFMTSRRSHKADLIRVGEVPYFILTCLNNTNKTLHHFIENYFEKLEEKNNFLPWKDIKDTSLNLNDLFQYIVDLKIRFSHLQGSAISDQLTSLQSNYTLEELQKSKGEYLSDPSGSMEAITEHMIFADSLRGHNCIALLDIQTANTMKKLLPKIIYDVSHNEEDKNFSIVKNLNNLIYSESSYMNFYSIKYTHPLPVGFFVPKGDYEYLSCTLKAIYSSVFIKNKWNKDFQNLMPNSGVILDKEPSLVVYSGDHILKEVPISAQGDLSFDKIDYQSIYK